MPSIKNEKQTKRLAFLADRTALLMVELVRRDLDYGHFCHERFYTDETAGYLKQGKEYEVCLYLVRRMIQRHDLREEEADAKAKALD